MVKENKMSNYKIKIRLYMESMFPLFFILGLNNLKYETLSFFITEPFIGAVYHFIRNNLFSTALLMLAVIAFISLLFGFQSKSAHIKSMKVKGLVSGYAYSYWIFFATYIIPCILICAFGYKGKMITLVLFVFIGIFSIHTSIYYKNPVLWFLGYRIYVDNAGSCVFITEGRLLKEDAYKGSGVFQLRIDETQYLIVNLEKFWRVKYLCRRMHKFGEWIYNMSRCFVQLFIRSFSLISKLSIVFVMKHPTIVALLYSTLIMFFMWVLGLMRWEGSDDFTMSQLFMGSSGERSPYVLTSSYYLGEIIVWLQRVAPIINWFTGLEILSVWIFFAILEWFVLKRSNRIGYSMALLIPVIFEPLYFLSLQYTRSAFLLPFGGLLLFYDATIREIFPDMELESNDKKQTFYEIRKEGGVICKILKIVFGIFLFIIGILFRYTCFYAGIAYVAILVFVYIVSAIKEKCFRKKTIRVVLFSAVIMVTVALSIAIDGRNTEIYNQWSRTNDYRTYNKIRSDVIDYIPSEYSREFSTDDFEISYNDWYMMKCCVINDQVFSYDYYEKVLKNLNAVREDDENAFMYNLRQVFYYRSGRVGGQRTQFVICVLICFTALLIVKKKLGILLDIIGTAILIGYFLAGNRFPPWVSDSIYMLASCIAIIYICCSEYAFKAKQKYRYAIEEYVVGMVFLSCLYINTNNAREFIKQDYYNDDLKQALQYAEENESIFLLDSIGGAPYLYIDVYGATYCFSEGQWDNIIRVGNWDVGHPERDRQKEALEIQSVIYSLVEGKSMLISRTDSNSFIMYEDFFKEHYNKEVFFTCQQDFGDYSIYSCTVKK